MQSQPAGTAKVENKIKFWSQELHDMSGRNRLLFYKETKTSTANIEKPGFIALFHLLVEQETELLAPLPDPREKTPVFDAPSEDDTQASQPAPKAARKLKDNEIQTNHPTSVLNKVLYNLRYASHTIQEEQGFNILFVTFGMLKWRETQNSDFSFAPLLLVPVQLQRDGPTASYKISLAEDDIVVNPVLQTKLSKEFSIELPEVGNDITLEQFTEFLATVSSAISNLDGWAVEERATIGIFNFLTLLLIKDFENYADLYKEHPIVRALSGIDGALPKPEKTPLAGELDDMVDPGTVYQIMDADSSQQEAIEAAKRGASIVLQGPPGTGKSQTIANIIAEFMMAGKKVLFVSQKMAALEVVQNRLNKKGLGDFCLEIHSHKMDKRKVIDNLMRSLSNTQIPHRQSEYPAQQQEIKQVRNDLNTYIRQLHQPRFELGISLYRAQGYLSQLLDESQLNFSLGALEQISPAQLSKMNSAIREITSYSTILTTYKQNRWKGFAALQISIQERETLSNNLRGTAGAISDFCQTIEKTVSSYGLPVPKNIQDCVDYLAILEIFTPGIFSPDLQTAIQNYSKTYQSFSRYFSFQYWKDSAALRSVYRKKTRPIPSEVLPTLKWVQVILKKAENTNFDLSNDNLPVEKLQKTRIRILDGCKAAEKLFGDHDQPEILKQKFQQTPDSLAAWFADHAEHTGELAEWANFNAVRKDCVDIGLGDFVAKAIDRELLLEKWEKAFLRRLYLLLVEKIAEDRPALQKFRGSLQSELIQRFKAIDTALIESTTAEIQAKLIAGKPQSDWIQSGSAETSVLRREYNKKRKIMPLRKLFHETPNLMQLLKPCLMMSPLTVCQLLDPKMYHFDVVIFDEASQIPPEYAIGAFLRAKQVIVAGDRNQLPPTNFFQAIESEETDEDDEELEANPLFESILNACDSSGFLPKTLNWHYRSKDEALIAYSNYHFYGNKLYTFPNSDSKSRETGLHYIYLPNGVYKRGAGARHNLIEARKVAELVFEHLQKTPELSLGIVAFSVSQRKAIETEIEVLRKENPDLNGLFSYDIDEPIFIKNLENVQGDERDVILLSVGYGKDESGKMALNFGPINREGGGRRLNVAVTRARFALKLITSIQPEDIDLARVQSQGAILLRNYLEVARDGVTAVFKDVKVSQDADFDSPFEESVYNELTRRGIQLIRQVGVSSYRIDLAVVDPDQPGRFLLGIECDGAMYHSAPTARDRDRLRQQVLENLGWRIYRIWSRDWIQNRSSEIDKVLKAIEQSKQQNLSSRSGLKKNWERP